MHTGTAKLERHVPVAATRVPLDMTQSLVPLRLFICSVHFRSFLATIQAVVHQASSGNKIGASVRVCCDIQD